MNISNFVAIDFETMTPELTSACAVGLVKVINGTIQKKFYSLIKPIPDLQNRTNTAIHGIIIPPMNVTGMFKDDMVIDLPKQ